MLIKVVFEILIFLISVEIKECFAFSTIVIGTSDKLDRRILYEVIDENKLMINLRENETPGKQYKVLVDIPAATLVLSHQKEALQIWKNVKFLRQKLEAKNKDIARKNGFQIDMEDLIDQVLYSFKVVEATGSGEQIVDTFNFVYFNDSKDFDSPETSLSFLFMKCHFNFDIPTNNFKCSFSKQICNGRNTMENTCTEINNWKYSPDVCKCECFNLVFLRFKFPTMCLDENNKEPEFTTEPTTRNTFMSQTSSTVMIMPEISKTTKGEPEYQTNAMTTEMNFKTTVEEISTTSPTTTASTTTTTTTTAPTTTTTTAVTTTETAELQVTSSMLTNTQGQPTTLRSESSIRNEYTTKAPIPPMITITKRVEAMTYPSQVDETLKEPTITRNPNNSSSGSEIGVNSFDTTRNFTSNIKEKNKAGTDKASVEVVLIGILLGLLVVFLIAAVIYRYIRVSYYSLPARAPLIKEEQFSYASYHDDFLLSGNN